MSSTAGAPRDFLKRVTELNSLAKHLQILHKAFLDGLKIQVQALPKRITGKGSPSTRVEGRHYPRHLRRWDKFTDSQKKRFDQYQGVFGNDFSFPSGYDVEKARSTISKRPKDESSVQDFYKTAVEQPVCKIVQRFLAEREDNPYDGIVKFSHHTHDAPYSDRKAPTIMNEDTEPPAKRMSHRLARSQGERPKGRCVYADEDLQLKIAFVTEYRAAQLITPQQLENAIDDTLFERVLDHISRQQTRGKGYKTTDGEKVDRLVTMYLIQSFDYMIELGLGYSYIAIGASLLFLHIPADAPSTLLYHIFTPPQDLPLEQIDPFKTAVAQVACFGLTAISAKERDQGWIRGAKDELVEWPIRYPTGKPGDDRDESEDPYRIKFTPINPKPKPTPAPLRPRKRKASAEPEIEPAAKPDREFCTLKCLLGLKHHHHALDDNCPNFASHQPRHRPEDQHLAGRHQLDIYQFSHLLKTHLAQHAETVLRPLGGNNQKNGATGFVFKVALEPYGYTFVAKGTIWEYRKRIEHEAAVYRHLERSEHTRDILPVYLGLFDLGDKPYRLTGSESYYFAGEDVQYLLCMAWAGEQAAEDMDVVEGKIKGSVARLRGAGVVHNDLRHANVLWSEERDGYVIIDFDRATILNPCRLPPSLQRRAAPRPIRPRVATKLPTPSDTEGRSTTSRLPTTTPVHIPPRTPSPTPSRR